MPIQINELVIKAKVKAYRDVAAQKSEDIAEHSAPAAPGFNDSLFHDKRRRER